MRHSPYPNGPGDETEGRKKGRRKILGPCKEAPRAAGKKRWLLTNQPEFLEDLRYWVKTDRKVALRVFDLVESLMRNPFEGIGKPEPLKFMLSGAWSRRLTQEHRIV